MCGSGHIACELESLRTCKRSTSPVDFNGCVRHNAARINQKCEGLMFSGELHGINRAITYLKATGVKGGKVGNLKAVRTQVLANS